MRLAVRDVIALLAASACGSGGTQPPSPTPPPRVEDAMVYDAARQQVLLFGGATADGTPLGDLWAWTGSAWTQVANGPPARAGAALTYDPVNQRVLLYGGMTISGTQFTDVWSWNGAAWSELSASGGPPIRHASGGYDAQRARLVVHRGFSGTAPQRDTWEWDGAQWTQVTTAVPVSYAVPLPSPMIYDATRQHLLMFIGDAGSNQTSLWEWNGALWTNLGAGPSMTTPAPLARLGDDDLLLLETNPTSGATGRTWSWNGSTWTASAAAGPSKRFASSMAFDLSRSQVVMFGGQTTSGSAVLGDTWVWDGSAWSQH